MRVLPFVMMSAFLPVACGDARKEAQDEARREVQVREAAAKKLEAAQAATEVKALPPVTGQRRIPCAQLVNPDAYTTALGEAAPLVLDDQSASSSMATATCVLRRGGTRPSTAQQQAMIKRQGKLGALPGDEVCRIAMYCWTIESEASLQSYCERKGTIDDRETGGLACVQTIATGEHDVQRYRMYDEDTKCLLDVSVGPGIVDNAQGLACAKLTRDGISEAALAPAN